MNTKFSIPFFLIAFLIMWGSFYTYIGICDPGGTFYSSFLDHYLNVTDWFAYFLSKSGSLLLNIFGMNSYVIYPYKIRFADGGGVSVGYTCLGAGVLSFWIAFVFAHKINNGFRIKWALYGVGILVGINIIRIALIALANNKRWSEIDHIDHHMLFNILCYCIIFGMMYVFAKKVKPNDAKV